MNNHWLNIATTLFVFETTFGKNVYDLPIDCVQVNEVDAVNAVPPVVSWDQTNCKLTLLPTPATSFKVVVEYSTI